MLTFDIKGNTKNRRIGPEVIGKKKFWLKKLNHKAVLRDLNFMEINKDVKDFIDISDFEKTILNKIIREDSIFLEKHNLMDYSLLLAIESKQNKNNKYKKNMSRNTVLSQD